MRRKVKLDIEVVKARNIFLVGILVMRRGLKLMRRLLGRIKIISSKMCLQL
jgi:hypothetical protein